jgi:hypothetical protein
LLSSVEAWAAAATVTETEYGYSVTGGTSETRIAAGRIRVRVIAYTATTANNVAAFRSGATSGSYWYMKAEAASAADRCYIYFGDNGVVFDELSVTLPAVTDVVQIYN